MGEWAEWVEGVEGAEGRKGWNGRKGRKGGRAEGVEWAEGDSPLLSRGGVAVRTNKYREATLEPHRRGGAGQ